MNPSNKSPGEQEHEELSFLMREINSMMNNPSSGRPGGNIQSPDNPLINIPNVESRAEQIFKTMDPKKTYQQPYCYRCRNGFIVKDFGDGPTGFCDKCSVRVVLRGHDLAAYLHYKKYPETYRF